ncbi:hypothetical protein GCM10022403_030180 [Streptomyces coacervatus]|uniref:Uncharacterized protein n=1 Tax=Streptomyces coacervatus TaxID=647381 RepID=A0ABP7HGT2_9ACTN|nr:hypothetical protein [Streptomyces coacervatus]MDF2271488.1 hypothetical protein [Streptomyces coacervatus]
MRTERAERDVRRQEYAARCLASGEQLYGAFSAGLDPLAPERAPRRCRPRRGGIAVVGVLVAPVQELAYKLEDWFWRGFGIRRLIRGRVWQGGWESDAGRFVIAVRAGDRRGEYENNRFLLTFTDRRVLLLSSPLSPERETPELFGEYPRHVIRLRSEPHPARHRNRVDLAFPDGSWVAVAIGRRDEVGDVRRYLAS